MDASTIAAVASAVAALASAVAAFKSHSLSQSVAKRAEDSARQALARDLSESVQLVELEADRTTKLCEKLSTQHDANATLAGAFAGSAYAEVKSLVTQRATRASELKDGVAALSDAAIANMPADALSDCLPRVRANLAEARAMFDETMREHSTAIDMVRKLLQVRIDQAKA